ncbi:MAG: hypothetical protein U1F30_15055 [Steroidobacteraceae bacterium]
MGDITLTGTDDNEYRRANGFISGLITSGVDYSLAAYYTTREYAIKNSNSARRPPRTSTACVANCCSSRPKTSTSR